MAAPGTIYDFTLNTLEGEKLPLARFRGQAVLIVNTASKCGFTPQYEGLQALWSSHRERGLTVIGVPSDDFGHQEPGSDDEIAAFCTRNYGVGFPMSEKLHVKGREAHPLFTWLAQQGGALSKPRWNFFKYIIARDGTFATWFSSIATPDSTRLRTAIERVVLDR